MEVQFAVAKISKYATSESGDTLEMIERPHGGISLVLVDGQRSGRSAKAISNVVARKAVQLLAGGAAPEHVLDGARNDHHLDVHGARRAVYPGLRVLPGRHQPASPAVARRTDLRARRAARRLKARPSRSSCSITARKSSGIDSPGPVFASDVPNRRYCVKPNDNMKRLSMS